MLSKKVEKTDKVTVSRKILIVHFVDHVKMGKSLDTRSHAAEGEVILGELISLSEHNDTFMRIDYKVKGEGKRDYAEFIPWAQVSKVIFEE
tara:strand:+ start:698 stop:970 length:273 start_codon:yes stop_codon:yes gene_type:complete